MYLRQDETIAIDPVWVLGVEAHEFVEHDMRHGCHAHGGSGMAGIGLEGGIDLWAIDQHVLMVVRFVHVEVEQSRGNRPLIVGAQLTANRRMVLIASSSSLP